MIFGAGAPRRGVWGVVFGAGAPRRGGLGKLGPRAGIKRRDERDEKKHPNN